MALLSWDVQRMREQEGTYKNTCKAGLFFLREYVIKGIPTEERLDFILGIKVNPKLALSPYQTKLRNLPYFQFLLNPPPAKKAEEPSRKKSLFSGLFH